MLRSRLPQSTSVSNSFGGFIRIYPIQRQVGAKKKLPSSTTFVRAARGDWAKGRFNQEIWVLRVWQPVGKPQLSTLVPEMAQGGKRSRAVASMNGQELRSPTSDFALERSDVKGWWFCFRPSLAPINEPSGVPCVLHGPFCDTQSRRSMAEQE